MAWWTSVVRLSVSPVQSWSQSLHLCPYLCACVYGKVRGHMWMLFFKLFSSSCSKTGAPLAWTCSVGCWGGVNPKDPSSLLPSTGSAGTKPASPPWFKHGFRVSNSRLPLPVFTRPACFARGCPAIGHSHFEQVTGSKVRRVLLSFLFSCMGPGE